jgi:hypothetical protein
MMQISRFRNAARTAAIALVPAALAACGGESAAPASVARDSAGVRIVQSERPAWKDGEGWTVGEAPSVDIGVVDGEAAYQLDRVRSAARLSDGRILVVNGGTQQLRLFAPNGKHLLSVGREGGGPGEFRGLDWAGAGVGDTLLAWDGQEKRLTVFTPAGTLVRTVQPQGPEGQYPHVFGTLADGSIVSTGGISFDFKMGEQRDTVRYHRFAADGRALGDLGRYPGMEAFVMELDNMILQDGVMFGRDVVVRPAGYEILVADNDRFEFRFLGVDGALRRIVRRPHQPVRVESADVDAYFAARERREGGSPDQVASFRRMQEKQKQVLPRRETFPAFSAVRTDTEGNLWAKEYGRPTDEQPRWSVFDREGRWLGTVETPAGFTVHQVGPDWILGIEKDELEVEHVRMYPLVKPAR